MNEISQTLNRLFEKHRIVFWYDRQHELQAEYEAVDLPEVTKIELGNNQFGLKYRLLRDQPEARFLLYQAGPEPEHLDNWLLDVQLAHGEFRADQAGLWLHELGLGAEFTPLVTEHADFFKAQSRRAALKSALKSEDSLNQIRLKMLAVCANSDARLDTILEALLAELAQDRAESIQLIDRCNLASYLWQRTGAIYGYESEKPTVRDFALTLFQAVYQLGLEESARLNGEAAVLLKRWKDTIQYQDAFATLSAEFAPILDIEADLSRRDYQKLFNLDLFELIERRILSELVREVSNRTLSSDTVSRLIRQRRQSIWYSQYQDLYEALDRAGQLLQRLEQLDLKPISFSNGLQQYTATWYTVDQLYRQFIYHSRRSGQTTLLENLQAEIENRYTNQYLLPLNDQWQLIIDEIDSWPATAQPSQREFFSDYVDRLYLRRNKKVAVVISDALRYEIGAELVSRIRQEDRFEANLAALVTLLPSFTQLGMAALLPNETLALSENGKNVLVDGQSATGTENRSKILQNATQGQAVALQAEQFLKLSRDESRQLFRDNQVIYLYHNRIDAVGDKRDSEERVFAAVEDCLEELILLIKRLANANVTNMLITADHGFIYQHGALDDSDFAGQNAGGQQVIGTNRRYVIGYGLTTSNSFKKFTAQAAGLDGDLEILLPKSINRLRVKGAGSRYVHGGASLQEIIVPLIEINKGRQSDIRKVEVEILRSGTTTISTNQVTIRFYQADAATDKVQPRQLRAAFYSLSGQLISDQHELQFDYQSDEARERELPVQFFLTRAADEANGQEIILRLEEQVTDTSHYQEYKSARYTLRRTFTGDFDF